MRIFYLTFRSVTFAQKAERVLDRQGIRCALQRTPKWMEEKGCGYSLRVWTEDIAAPVAQLRTSGVPPRKLYRQHASGELEEVTL